MIIYGNASKLAGFLFLLASSSVISQDAALVATLDPTEKLQPGVSLVWSPTGQAAWDMMKLFHKVDAIELDPPSPAATYLNKFKWDATKVMPPGTYIFGGMDSRLARQEVREQVRRLAGPNAAAMIDEYLPPGPVAPGVQRLDSALFVSCLAQKTKFPGRFLPDAKPRPFKSKSTATLALGFGCSGSHSSTFAQNVVVLKDDLNGCSVLKLALYSETPELSQSLILLRHPQLKSMDQGLAISREAIKNPMPELSIVEAAGKNWRYTHQLLEGDTFWMPRLKASLLSDFPEITDRSYLRMPDPERPGYSTEWRIREAKQFLHLDLNHEGALVEAVFKIVPDFLSIGGGSSAPDVDINKLPDYPKHFIHNQPFLACLWLKDAEWPYLACWVDGPGLLRAQ